MQRNTVVPKSGSLVDRICLWPQCEYMNSYIQCPLSVEFSTEEWVNLPGLSGV